MEIDQDLENDWLAKHLQLAIDPGTMFTEKVEVVVWVYWLIVWGFAARDHSLSSSIVYAVIVVKYT